MIFLWSVGLAVLTAITIGPICIFGSWFLNQRASFGAWMAGILAFCCVWVGLVAQVLYWLGAFAK